MCKTLGGKSWLTHAILQCPSPSRTRELSILFSWTGAFHWNGALLENISTPSTAHTPKTSTALLELMPSPEPPAFLQICLTHAQQRPEFWCGCTNVFNKASSFSKFLLDCGCGISEGCTQAIMKMWGSSTLKFLDEDHPGPNKKYIFAALLNSSLLFFHMHEW